MKLRNVQHWFRKQPDASELPIVSEEETQQLDLLLGEMALNEQKLSPAFWADRAQAFTDKIALQETAGKAQQSGRFAQLKPYLTSLLPLGGLVALGIVLSGRGVETNISDTPSAAPSVLAPHTFQAPREPRATVNDRASTPAQASLDVSNVPTAELPGKRTSQPSPLPRTTAVKAKPRVVPLASSASEQVTDQAPAIELPVQSSPETKAPEVTAERDTFGEQLQALKRADKALKSGDNASAQAALSRNFSPQFSLHANALRAVLACQNRDLTVGKRYLEAQAKSHPNSPYLTRMRRACGVTEPTND